MFVWCGSCRISYLDDHYLSPVLSRLPIPHSCSYRAPCLFENYKKMCAVFENVYSPLSMPLVWKCVPLHHLLTAPNKRVCGDEGNQRSCISIAGGRDASWNSLHTHKKYGAIYCLTENNINNKKRKEETDIFPCVRHLATLNN